MAAALGYELPLEDHMIEPAGAAASVDSSWATGGDGHAIQR